MRTKKKFNILSNNFIALRNYHGKRTTLSNKPSYIWIEPTNNCNLKCIMCPTGTGMVDVDKGFMDFALYKRIIDEISEYASAITLAISGESLLHPDFFKMIEYASSNGTKVLLNTNATLLTNEKTVSGYEWSSPKGPPLTIHGGTICTTSITVRKQPPISLVIPLLRKYLLGYND